jgi:hypothetical protein
VEISGLAWRFGASHCRTDVLLKPDRHLTREAQSLGGRRTSVRPQLGRSNQAGAGRRRERRPFVRRCGGRTFRRRRH